MTGPKKKICAGKTRSPSKIATSLLGWYDAHARDLPWRVGPSALAAGERPNPYAVWLSEIMLQQTTVATVTPRFAAFLKRWPTVEALAAAPLDDVLSEWAGLGYYARARNLYKCAQAVAAHGAFPDTEEGLQELPGIGAYTAAAIAAIAFDRPAIVVDGNVERVAARLFAIEMPLPKAKAELKEAIGAIWPQRRSGDFAQALMDLGATICTPRSPDCSECPLSATCLAFERDEPEAFPKRAAKKPKPTRYGIAYALFNKNGEVLLERRPEKGLLGGMLGLPGTEWAPEKPAPAPPAKAEWRGAGAVRHTFTHFHLELDVFAAPAPRAYRASAGRQWITAEGAKLPTVMKKAVDKALG